MTVDYADIDDARYRCLLLLDRQTDPAGVATFSKFLDQSRLRQHRRPSCRCSA